ncbi:MAG: hypothetical protein IPM29_09965 [Planctomycetes bacterium]|nr:hypothetical protein [Planctomycetota bacterium]
MRIALVTCRGLPDWEVDDRPLHEHLVRCGVELHRPAWDDPAIDWARFDACLLRTTWDYQERLGKFVAWIERAARSTRLFNPREVVLWNTHKSYLRDLQALGMPLAPTVWLARGTAVDIAALCAERGFAHGFLKPMIGATARETLRFRADADGLAAAQAHVDRLLPHEDLILQRYLHSVEASGELSAIWIDGTFTHTVRKIPPPGDYRVQDDFGARDEPFPFAPAELDLAAHALELAARHLGLPGPAALLYGRVDFLRDDAGALVLNELELVEPSLFFRHAPHAAERLGDALLRRVAVAAPPC